MTTALSTRLLTTVDEFIDSMTRLQDKCNLISPLMAIDFIPAMKGVSLRTVLIRPDDKAGEVYKAHWCNGDERGLTKVALFKIWQAAGGSMKSSRRIDDGAVKHYCEWETVVTLQQLDGREVDFIGNRALDLREGSPELTGKTSKQIEQSRARLTELNETFAFERAIRGALALRQKYTLEELKLPFIVPALVDDFDMGDPDVKRALLASRFGKSEQQLFGPGAGANERVIDVPASSVQTSAAGPAAAEDEDFGAPPPAAAAEESSAPEAVCMCPCQHDIGITKEIADKTLAAVGSPRCRICFPGKFFEFAPHQHLRTLELPKNPTLTPAQADAYAKQQRGQGGAR